MSNKVEAALGPINSFTDAEGEVYTVERIGGTLTLSGKYGMGSDGTDKVIFFTDDAAKIIALIAEAAK